MAMEIRISAIEMLKVLVHAGIETTDAKAIIFDLLQYPEKLEKGKEKDTKEIIPRRGRPKKITTDSLDEKDGSTSDDELADSENKSEEDDDEEEEEEQPLKRPKRISFKNFGGVAQLDTMLRKTAAHAK
jgi:hypothetical protein